MIHLLPDHVINKLKAGEIVERPASILKECIENALDAEATHIIVSLTDGGNTAIHVQDNGTGIAADDAGLVLARYATSKISSDSDLQSLYSYGFRGEALASIAEISNVIIQTKTQDAPIGTRIQKTQTGLQHSPESVSREHGTKCMVQDIFYNTPARAKFLKTPQTEYTYCQQLFFAYVMCRQDIHRELRHNDKKKYDIRPESSTQARIASIYKKNRADNVSEIYTETDHLQIS